MKVFVVLMVIILAKVALNYPATIQRLNTEKENIKIANKSLEFANIIRQNLRRNNDDYDAKSFWNESHRLPKHTTNSYKISQIGRKTPKRKSLNLVSSKYTSPKPLVKFMEKHVSSHPVRPKFVNVSKNRVTIATSRNLGATFRSNDRHQNLRLDQLKRLINKGKLKLAEIARTTKTTSIIDDTSPQRPIRLVTTSFVETTTNPDMSPTTERLVEIVRPLPATHHAYPVRWPDPQSLTDAERDSDHVVKQPAHLRSPSPDQLDMAHARGSGIRLMRVRGRLCQRVVLNREGPWYNSRGQVIMTEHKPELTRGKEFYMTRTPEFVLPRCCNCCKKSVLGCQ